MKNIAPPLSLLAFAFFLLFSCSSDEVKSSENYILGFEIEVSPIEIDINNGLIYVRTFPENKESLLSKTPEVKVSEKATLSDNGRNWTEAGFKYTVTAENGDARDYSIEIDASPAPKKYSFETWKSPTGRYKYDIPSGSNFGWSSGNAGIAMALDILKKDVGNPEIYPTKKTDEGYVDKAALMETIEGGVVFGRDVSLISGNFFLGNFNAQKAITDELAATELGRIYPAKPKTIKGYYKYTQGPGDFKNKGTVEPNRPDSCNMSIRFYRSDINGKDTTLTVKDIDDSPLVIGQVTNPENGCFDTGGEFKQFELDLEYTGEYNPTHRYKLAITFAASRNGDKYAGKIGSKLIVDEIEIEDY